MQDACPNPEYKSTRVVFGHSRLSTAGGIPIPDTDPFPPFLFRDHELVSRSLSSMSRHPIATTSSLPNILPPQHAESKRDRKRRETVNKVELLNDESWRSRDE